MVNKGDLIGVEPGTRNAVPSPASGVVKEVSFDPVSHTLMVSIDSKEQTATRGRRRPSGDRAN